MERIQALLDKLNQQYADKASAQQLLTTVQLLQSELLQLQPKAAGGGTSKVSVTMPMNLSFSSIQPAVESHDKEIFTLEPLDADLEAAILKQEALDEEMKQQKPAPAYQLKKPVVETPHPPKPEMAEHQAYLPVENPKPVSAPVVEEKPVQKAAPVQSSFYPAFDAEEAPTLAQHTPARELHETIAQNKESLNDRLKQEKTELVHVLKETPIKDLKKAIGINERFSFVNDLFRGDEAMYERSIKTINSFNILSEAEYWMSRELKFKLGWNDTQPTVQQFYQLVRRRFS